MKHHELTHHEWEVLRGQLKETYGARILISWVMRKELGFSIREHQRWDDTHKRWEDRRSVICVDFYSEAARTFFLLKYT